MTFRPTVLTIHYTATFEDQNPSVAEITRWHKAVGMRTFAYHWYIDRVAKLFEGRPETEMGAGVRSHNGYTLHVAWAGGCNRATGKDIGVWNITPEQEQQLIRLIKDILGRHPSITRVVGHKDLVATECPGLPKGGVEQWWKTVQAREPAARPQRSSGGLVDLFARLFAWLGGR